MLVFLISSTMTNSRSDVLVEPMLVGWEGRDSGDDGTQVLDGSGRNILVQCFNGNRQMSSFGSTDMNRQG